MGSNQEQKQCKAAGNLWQELEEMDKMGEKTCEEENSTIGEGGLLTILCC